MDFKGFLAELAAVFSFSPVVMRIDGIIQKLKVLEPNIDNQLFLYSKTNIGGRENVLQFFINALLEMRETVSRNARDKGLLKTITPLYKKLQKDINKLENGDEGSKKAMAEFGVADTLAAIYDMIEEVTSRR